jgi:hypothetical protein
MGAGGGNVTWPAPAAALSVSGHAPSDREIMRPVDVEVAQAQTG